MEFRNFEKFKTWYVHKAKAKVLDWEAVKDEIEEQFFVSANPSFALKAHETKSRNPECYTYEVEIFQDLETDTWTYTYIF